MNGINNKVIRFEGEVSPDLPPKPDTLAVLLGKHSITSIGQSRPRDLERERVPAKH